MMRDKRLSARLRAEPAILLTCLFLVVQPDPSAASDPGSWDDSTGWQWQNPLPQGNSLYDVVFVDENVGFAAATGGSILRTSRTSRSR